MGEIVSLPRTPRWSRPVRVGWCRAQVRLDRPLWRRIATFPFGPCECITHDPDACDGTWRRWSATTTEDE